MKSYHRICITLIMFLCTNVVLGQGNDTISISLDEIKDMPQKIITAYFKPINTYTGVQYPLMQWYALENKVDTWDKKELDKLNATIYGFKDDPIKAAEFALLFCMSFGENDFTDNFKAIGFNSVEINSILRCYRIVKKRNELDLINQWQKNGIPQFDNNETSISAKYHISIDDAKINKYLADNIKRNLFDDYIQIEINTNGTYSSSSPQYDFIQISNIVPAQQTFTYADTSLSVPVYSIIKITENLVDKIDYNIEIGYNKKENKWIFKTGTFREDYFWEQIKKSTPYYNYINVAIEKLLELVKIDTDCQCKLEFSIGKSVIEVSQADKDNSFSRQEVVYNNNEIPYIRLVTLYKKNKGDSFFDKIPLEKTKLRKVF